MCFRIPLRAKLERQSAAYLRDQEAEQEMLRTWLRQHPQAWTILRLMTGFALGAGLLHHMCQSQVDNSISAVDCLFGVAQTYAQHLSVSLKMQISNTVISMSKSFTSAPNLLVVPSKQRTRLRLLGTLQIDQKKDG